MNKDRDLQLLYLDFCNSVNTRDEAGNLLKLLSELDSQLFRLPQTPEEAVESVLGYAMMRKISLICHKRGIDTSKLESYRQVILDIRAFLKSLPTVSLVLGFEPNTKLLKSISDWFIVNLKRKVLLDIRVDSSIVGGAIVVRDGKYRDFSLKSKIEARYGKSNLFSLAWT